MRLFDSFGDTLRIAIDANEQSLPYSELVAAMTQYLIQELGKEKAAKYEHVSVSDPGFAHFRRIVR